MRDTERRELLWKRQSGKCGYCRRPTILPAVLVEQFAGPFKDEELGSLIEALLMNDEHFKERWHDDLATLEHIKPKSEGGRNTLDNLMLACAACNQEEGAKLLQAKQEAQRSQISEAVS